MAPQLVSSQSKSEAIAHNEAVDSFYGDGLVMQERVEKAIERALTKYIVYVYKQCTGENP